MTMDNRKLLLVDDDDAVLVYLTAKLSKHFDIVSTTTPGNAAALARQHLPDAILCDIDMPEMGGGDVAAELQNDTLTARIPLIYLTALVSPEETKEMEGQVGGRPGVSKRASLQELLERIEEVIGKR
jgi:CheY-like chemotaxis protein